MTKPGLSRRRFILVAAAMGALGSRHAAAGVQTLRWRGRAMGADAELVLDHPDGALARAALSEALTEIERLEAILSLYHSRSALVRLNAEGELPNPPLDLVRILDEATAISAASDGAFDVTVQPLWRLHAQSFAATGRPPKDAAIARALALADWRMLNVAPDRIAFGKKGMAATLNGIGQGYVTDRVAELLRRRGFTNVLVDLGEPRVLGPHADGSPWTIAVRDPADPGRRLHNFTLTEGALATTEALGSSFSEGGAFGHVVDPHSGRAALTVRSVTVRASTATLADGLSTAIAAAGADKAGALISRFPGTSAFL